jgi:hypothetical protein
MRVIIVGSGNPRGTLAASRYLHRAGWTVSLGTADVGGLPTWSRATEGVHPVPPVQRGLDAFLAATAEAVRASRSELVLPASDADLVALSLGRDRIPATVPLADHAVVLRSVDKLELVRAGLRAGLAAPVTEVADDDALARARYPVVVKSRFHWLPEHAAGAPSRLEAEVCPDRAGARSVADRMRRAGGEPLVQEFMEGGPVNVHLVTDGDSRTLSMVQQEGAELYFPPGAGRRTRSVTVAMDRGLEAGIRALMRELGWRGFAGVAFQRGADGVPHVIDFNGRLPSNIEASAGAGSRHIEAWAALATGRRPPPLDQVRVGMRFQWLEGDLRRALRERRGGLLRDVGTTLAYAPRAQHTVAKWDEPTLVVRYSARLLRESLSARRRG